MTDTLLEYIKQGYIQKTVSTMQYPDYSEPDVQNYVDKKAMQEYLNNCTFKERLPYLKKLAKVYDEGDTPKANYDPYLCKNILNVFIKVIENDAEFIDELITIYSHQIYFYVSDKYLDDSAVYDDECAGREIEDTKELGKFIQLIAAFEG